MYEELVKRLKRECVHLPQKFSKNAELLDVLMKAADAIEELWKKYLASEVDATNLTGWLAEEHAKHLWIPVTERLPEPIVWVLCYCRANEFNVMRMTSDGEWQYGNRAVYMKGYVTHWMPLPEPPKEKT